MTVRGRAARGPGGTRPRVSGPSPGGGGAPLAWRGGYGADVPLPGLLHSAGWGEERGERGGGLHRGSSSPPLVPFPGGCGGWLEGPGPVPPAGSGSSRAPPCKVLGPGCLASLGTWRGPGVKLLAGQSLPSCPPMCCTVRLGGGGGEGGQGGGPRFWGSVPGGGASRADDPHSPPAPLLATGPRAVVWASAHGIPHPESPLPRRAAPWRGGRGSSGRLGRPPGSAISGQWSAARWDSLAARSCLPRAAGASPPFLRPPSPRPGLPPVLLLRGRRGGSWGVRALRVGGTGPARGVPRAAGPLLPPRAHCLGSGARFAGPRAIAVGLGPHLRIRLPGGWGCGGDGFLRW